MSTIEAHYYEGVFPHPGGAYRPCKVCGSSYDAGDHIEITTLKPFTSYVCPANTGELEHSGIWTGAYLPELRTLRDHLCICGREFVEEDQERWLLKYELGDGVQWHPVEVVRSKHAASTQHAGLLQLIEEGELIRNVSLSQLVEATGT